MLALTREPIDGSDTIVAKVGDTTIRFTVVFVEGSQVRIGVEAPEEILVLREELLPVERGEREWVEEGV